jgi:hypothetical protein
MARITTLKYSFKPPERISEMDYYSYKQMIEVDYSIDICPKQIQEDGGISVQKIARWSLTAVAVFIAPAVVISKAETEISRSRANNAMKRFYNDDLKRMIERTKNYPEFSEQYDSFFKQYLKANYSTEYWMKYEFNK